MMKFDAGDFRTLAQAACGRLAAALLALAAAALPVSDALAQAPNAERGRLLYENHCQLCHTPQVHSRPNKLPITRDELRMLVDTFRRQAGLGWTRDESKTWSSTSTERASSAVIEEDTAPLLSILNVR